MSQAGSKVSSFIASIHLKDSIAVEDRLERLGFGRYLANKQSAGEDVEAPSTSSLHGSKLPQKRRSIRFSKALTSFAPAAHDTVAGPIIPLELTSPRQSLPPPPSARQSNLSTASRRPLAAENSAGTVGRADSIAGSMPGRSGGLAQSQRGGHHASSAGGDAASSGLRGTQRGPATTATTQVGPGGFKKRRTPPLVVEPSPELETRLNDVFVSYAMHGSLPNSVYLSYPKFFRLLHDSGALLVQSADFHMVEDVFARVKRGRKAHPFGSDEAISFWEFVDALQRLARRLNEMSAPIDAANEVMDVVATTDPGCGAEREDVLTELVHSSAVITELRGCEPQLKLLHTCYRGAGEGVREDNFVKFCADFKIVPLLAGESAAREAFQQAVKAGTLLDDRSLCWVGLGEALARLGLQSSQGHVAASPAPSPNKATERPGTAATNKTTSSRSAEKAPAVEPTSATFIRAITFDGPSTTVAGLTKIQLTAKALFNATDEWGYRSVLTDMNGSIGGAADASGRRARTPAGGEEAAATAGA